MVKLLLDSGATIDDDESVRAMKGASLNGHFALAKLLEDFRARHCEAEEILS